MTICKKKKKKNEWVNLRDMRFLLDVHISSEKAYVKILPCLKLLKMVYAGVLEPDIHEDGKISDDECMRVCDF